VVDHVEALGARRPVDAADIGEVDEPALHVVAQEGQKIDDASQRPSSG
jgi:hypothetical protein